MAATGTPTPNLGLRRAQGTDPASVDDINYNSELLDTKLGAVGATSVQGQIDALSASTAQTFGNVQDGLAIVSNGNTHVAIPAGYWVYVKGHGTLSEGLYKNTSGATIAANATLSTSNLTADPDGGLNSVYNALNSKLTPTTGDGTINTTNITSGNVIYQKTGRIVVVDVYNILAKVRLNGNQEIATGLPNAIRQVHVLLGNNTTHKTVRLEITTTGKLNALYDTIEAEESIFGTFTYTSES